MLEKINGIDYAKMIIAAAANLERNKEKLNQLNVFPVPDGDTGTNMAATLKVAAEKISQAMDVHLGKVADIAAQGALFGARGNSGVILSQVLRGFARGFKNKREAGVSELSKAFQYGVVYAYRAVAQPVEGTILTVLREIGKGFKKSIRNKVNIIELIDEAIRYGEVALAKTPELLPALKKAGVVDSGGMGLVLFLQGCLAGLKDESITLNLPEADFSIKKEEQELDEVGMDYIYCTEFIIKGEKLFLEKIRQELMEIGGSLIVAGDENVVKVHIHTNHPGEALELGLRWGLIYNIKIDNMLEQSQEKQKPAKKLGMVAVSPGKGFSEIFQKLGIDEIVDGGQTANPPVSAIVEAINRVPATKVIVFPNNKNIILAAEQAKNLTNKSVTIVNTKNPAQTVAVSLYFDENAEPEELITKINEHLKNLKVIEVTRAVREVRFGELEIKSDDYIAIFNGDIIAAGKDVLLTSMEAVAKVINEDNSLISVFTGEEVLEDVAEKFVSLLEEKYAFCDVEKFYGGQKNYPFYIVVE